MNLTVVTPPPFYAISLAQVYEHLRLDTEGSPPTHPLDATLARHIRTATSIVESLVHRTFVQRTLRLSAPNFPGGSPAVPAAGVTVSRMGRNWIELLNPPVSQVLAVSYIDAGELAVDVDGADYFVTADEPPRVQFADGFGVGATAARNDAVRIEYVAGYAPGGSPPTTQEEYAANVPDVFQDAILFTVQLLYENLSPTERESIERARDAILSPHVVQVLA